MEFGIFNAVCLTPKFRAQHGANAEHRRIMDELAYIRAADKAGFKYVWASEHHFLEEYSHLSANESFLAFAAAQTKNIHLGSGIINLTPPVNHPARIAERVAMLDHLSEGRFEFGTGRGSSTTEQRGFGIEDQELTREMVAETLPQIVRMWKEKDYSYDGRFFSMPERNVLPKPYTNPHPPLWVAAGSPGTFEIAARQGLGVLCFAFGAPEQFIPLIEKYKKEIKNAEPVGGYVNDNIMITTQMLCLEDGGKARQAFSEMDSGYYLSLVFRYLDTFPRPKGIPEWPDTIPDQSAEQINKAIDSGSIAVGDPEEVERSIKRFEETGADQLSFGMLSSAMPIETCEEAVATFGKHVLPKFDKDPVHSTTRQRIAQIGS
jgi:alkanesulfonate monooxygenase SsuD/methylene tetrahydromethanopterin reductase-like flavin-dependent oxidoreductase (luciferase family)